MKHLYEKLKKVLCMYEEKGNLENITLIFSRIRSSFLYRNQEKNLKGGARENNNIYALVVDLLQYIDTFYFNAKILYNKSLYSDHYIQSIKVSNNISILNILSIVIHIENYFVKLFEMITISTNRFFLSCVM